MRVLVLDLRREPGPAQAGGPRARADVPLRGLQAGRRGVRPLVLARLRARVRRAALLQRLRARARIRSPQYAAVIPKFMAACLDEQAPTIFGDGEQSRDFTYVDNVVDANLLALEAPGDGRGARLQHRLRRAREPQRAAGPAPRAHRERRHGRPPGRARRRRQALARRHLARARRARLRAERRPPRGPPPDRSRTFERVPTPTVTLSGDARVRVVRVIARLNAGGPAHHVGLLSSRLGDGYETLLVHGRRRAGRGPARGVRRPLSARGVASSRTSGARSVPCATCARSCSSCASCAGSGPISFTLTPPRQGCSAGWPRSPSGRGRSSCTPTTATSSRATSERSRPRSTAPPNALLARASDASIGVSDATVADLRRFRIGSDRTLRVLRIGLDLDGFTAFAAGRRRGVPLGGRRRARARRCSSPSAGSCRSSATTSRSARSPSRRTSRCAWPSSATARSARGWSGSRASWGSRTACASWAGGRTWPRSPRRRTSPWSAPTTRARPCR